MDAAQEIVETWMNEYAKVNRVRTRVDLVVLKYLETDTLEDAIESVHSGLSSIDDGKENLELPIITNEAEAREFYAEHSDDCDDAIAKERGGIGDFNTIGEAMHAACNYLIDAEARFTAQSLADSMDVLELRLSEIYEEI